MSDADRGSILPPSHSPLPPAGDTGAVLTGVPTPGTYPFVRSELSHCARVLFALLSLSLLEGHQK